jgi:hypothetical protein
LVRRHGGNLVSIDSGDGSADAGDLVSKNAGDGCVDAGEGDENANAIVTVSMPQGTGRKALHAIRAARAARRRYKLRRTRKVS